MENIFKNAKFSNRYKTRDNRIAVFLGEFEDMYHKNAPKIYKLWIEGEEEPINCEANGKLYGEAYTQFEDGSVETYSSDIIEKID